jgi:hypothetical protein
MTSAGSSAARRSVAAAPGGTGLSSRVVSGSGGPIERVWVAECDRATAFSSLASIRSGIGFARIAGTTVVHLRGPAKKATELSCPRDSEYFGVDFRVGTYLPAFPPGRLSDLRDAVLPVVDGGRILLDGQAWEMPTPQNLDVFLDRLRRAGLLVADPLVEEMWHGGGSRKVPARTAQSRFARAAGLPRRTLLTIERARAAAGLLRAGVAIGDVVIAAGYHDQPHLTRSLRRMIGYTPGELARGEAFLAL